MFLQEIIRLSVHKLYKTDSPPLPLMGITQYVQGLNRINLVEGGWTSSVPAFTLKGGGIARSQDLKAILECIPWALGFLKLSNHTVPWVYTSWRVQLPSLFEPVLSGKSHFRHTYASYCLCFLEESDYHSTQVILYIWMIS